MLVGYWRECAEDCNLKVDQLGKLHLLPQMQRVSAADAWAIINALCTSACLSVYVCDYALVP
jgi:hypothetical protein